VNGISTRTTATTDAGAWCSNALGVPLSVDWGTIYSPQTGGAYFHSSVLPESAIGRPWISPASARHRARRSLAQVIQASFAAGGAG